MRKNLTNSYLSTLCLEMSMLLHAGIGIGQGIEIILEDEPNKDARKVLQLLSDNLSGGVSLATAMTKTGLFPAYMVRMIEIGERTGRITETLTALSEHYERQEKLALAVKNATFYPAILLGMMIVVVLVLIVQVLPIFNDVFARMGAQMSPLAERLMQFGDWFRGASVVIAIVVGAIFVCIFLMWAIGGIRRGIARFARNKWSAKGLFGRVASYQFISSMSLALSSGLGVQESIELAASVNSDSAALNKKYQHCLKLLNEGNSLADALRESGIVSVRNGRLLALGDKSGMADATMSEIARRSDAAVQEEISTVVGRIEPALVIATSVIIGVILLSVMLPLVGIMTSIG